MNIFQSAELARMRHAEQLRDAQRRARVKAALAERAMSEAASAASETATGAHKFGAWLTALLAWLASRTA